MKHEPHHMTTRFLFLTLLLSASATAFFAPAASPALAPPPVPSNLPDIVENVLPGVVNISSTTIVNYRVLGWDDFLQHWGIPQERKHTSLGSGFIIDKNEGFILTNFHVISQADEVLVTLKDKRQFKARIIGKDEKMDIALIQIRDNNRKVPQGLVPVTLGNSDTTRIAEPVFAVGNPFGLQHTVTTGIISAKNRTIGAGAFDNFLQTDASINPGNSGGPLFDFKGDVIGINTMILSRTGQSSGLGMAIPVNEAKRVLPDLNKYGRVPRPWLGIMGEPVTPSIQHYYGLGISKGVMIFNMVEGAPADAANLRPGDVIVSVDGTTVEDPYEIERALAKHKPKDKVKLGVRRGRKTLETTVRLEELPPLARLPQGVI